MSAVAFQLAKQGFRVFPLRPGRKIPAWKNWKERATTDLFTVLETWPANAPAGIATGYDLTVIDVEAAGIGSDNVALQLPPTLTVRTPRGGLHYYYKTPAGQAFGNSVKKIAPNTDVRGVGGLVAGPGATFRDPDTGELGHYAVHESLPMAELPAHLFEKLNAAPVRTTVQGAVLGDVDTPNALKDAAAYLADLSDRGPPRFILPGGRGAAAYRVATRLGDFGISLETAYELVQGWNEHYCTPPQDDDELAACVEHAYEYRQDPVGRENALAHFTEVEEYDDSADLLEYAEDILDDEIIKAEESALIEGLLYPKDMGMLYGESTTGKTFAALDMAWHLAQGKNWHGHAVKKRLPVLYVCLEGVSGFRKRMRAAAKEHGATGKWFARMKAHPSLIKGKTTEDGKRGEAGVFEIIKAARALARKCGAPTAIIYIDTFRRAIAGDDENATETIMHFIEHRAGAIQRETGAAVCIVHHTNRQGTFAGNGSSFGACDLVIKATRKGHVRTLVAEKVKDGEEGKILDYELKIIQLGVKENGAAVTSCVVQLTHGAAADPEPLLSALAGRIEGSMSMSAAVKILKATPMFESLSPETIRKRVENAFMENNGWLVISGVQYNFIKRGTAGGEIVPATTH